MGRGEGYIAYFYHACISESNRTYGKPGLTAHKLHSLWDLGRGFQRTREGRDRLLAQGGRQQEAWVGTACGLEWDGLYRVERHWLPEGEELHWWETIHQEMAHVAGWEPGG